MTITVHCPCGKHLVAKAEAAGKRVKCPACGSVSRVPVSKCRYTAKEGGGAAHTPPPENRPPGRSASPKQAASHGLPQRQTTGPAPGQSPAADGAGPRAAPPTRSRWWLWLAAGAGAVVVTAALAIALGLRIWPIPHATAAWSLDDAIRASVGAAPVTARDEWDGAGGPQRALVAAGGQVYYFTRDPAEGWLAVGKTAIPFAEHADQNPPVFLAFSPQGNGAIIALPFKGTPQFTSPRISGTSTVQALGRGGPLVFDRTTGQDIPGTGASTAAACYHQDNTGGHLFVSISIAGDRPSYGINIDEDITPEGEKALRERVAAFLREAGGYEERAIRLQTSLVREFFRNARVK